MGETIRCLPRFKIRPERPLLPRLYLQTERRNGEATRCWSGTVAGGQVGSGVDVSDARFLLVDGHRNVLLDDLPVCLAGHGIDWNLAQVAGDFGIVDQIVELSVCRACIAKSLSEAWRS